MKSSLLAIPCLLWMSSSLPAAGVDYARDIQPILAQKCVNCHGAGKAKGKLRLDTVAAALKGGRSGPSVVPGKSDDSPLFQSVAGTGEVPRMPPKGPGLNQKQLALLKTWIDAGAKAPANDKPVAAGGGNVQPRGGDGDDDRRMNRRDRNRRGRERERERERGRERERERERNEKEKNDRD